MCEKFVNDKLNFINQIFKDEFDLITITKNSVSSEEKEEDDFDNTQNNIRPIRPRPRRRNNSYNPYI